MIRCVEPSARIEEKHLIDAYFRLRKHIFCDHFGWVDGQPDGREIDEFDSLDNIYVLNVHGDSGRLVGGARLMPTTGPTLLHAQWAHLLPDPDQYRAADLWEVTRFCVDDRFESRKAHFANRATVELAVGLMQAAAKKRVSRLIGICDLSFFNMAAAFGKDPEIIATHSDSGGHQYGCGIFSVDPNMAGLPWARGIVEPRRNAVT